MDRYEIFPPKIATKVPILISCPHAGTAFPSECRSSFYEKFIAFPEDTDWYVPELYDFARDLGVTLIASHISRYVIDLNRSPDSDCLYNDGRPPSLLIPRQSFAGEDLYQTGRQPSSMEIEARKKNYYDPYHEKVKNILEGFKSDFGSALLFEAHSIKRKVPSIRAESFPDLMLGTYDGKSLPAALKGVAEKALQSFTQFSLAIDDPFKGGYLTRKFGLSNSAFASIQLELCQDLYLAEEGTFDPNIAAPLQAALKHLIASLALALKT